MSDERSVRALYAALAAGDRPALEALLHPELVVEATDGLPLELGGTYEGPAAALRDFWGRIGRAYRLRAEPRELIPTGDGRLVVLGRYVGSDASGARPVDAAFVHLVAFRDGRIVGLRQLTDSQRWVEALGTTPPPRTETLELTLADGLAHIRLARPEQRNAIVPAVAAELRDAARWVAGCAEARALLISGAGPAFTVGGDLRLFADAGDELPGLLESMIADYHVALEQIAALELPVVCAVQGGAGGGGLGLMWASDLVLAASDLKLAMGFTAAGLTCDGGNSWYLPRIVGIRRALELALENRALSAQEALDWGLVTRVVEPEALDAEALALATELAQGATLALGGIRHLMRAGLDRTLGEQLAAEWVAMGRIARTRDAPAGLAAFAAKRRPRFEGR